MFVFSAEHDGGNEIAVSNNATFLKKGIKRVASMDSRCVGRCPNAESIYMLGTESRGADCAQNHVKHPITASSGALEGKTSICV